MDKSEAFHADTGPATLRQTHATATSPQRWQRLQELFDGLVERGADERATWLAGLDDDETLKCEALQLAAGDDGERGDGLAGFLRAPPPPPGQRLGPYRLVGEIGSGGMGTVFLAERADGSFAQRVAIKLLRGFPTRESTGRMRRERQILADLQHPNIARLLDGGSTPDGQPYLVMEHVDGVPLDEHLARHDPPLRLRLKLVQQICAAVQFAHQSLVIHRDLKPGNVLVRADGEPVLLDFGIAKLLVDTSPSAPLTRSPLFTPAYASPEQRRGEPVSTATDVYSLGALLHEVLTGRPPPANAPGAGADRTTKRRLDRDLERILARAMHADPERRYPSAAALADDLLRYQRGRPVRAAPDRLPYRAAKFVRRNRFAVAALAIAAAAAALFAVQLARERDRALRAEAEARQQTTAAENVVDYLVALFRPASPDVAGTRPIAPRDLVDRGRREIEARLADAPQQRARLLGSLGSIYLQMGLIDAAREALGRAVELGRLQDNPKQLASHLSDHGFTLLLSDHPAAAIPVLGEALARLGPVEPRDRRLASEILSMLGSAQLRTGRLREAEENMLRSLAHAEAADGERSVAYARCVGALAEVELRTNRLDEAERDSLRSLAILRELLREDSADVIGASSFVALVQMSRGRYAESEQRYRDALAQYLHAFAPGSSWAIVARNNLALATAAQGRLDEAADLLRENLDLLRAGHAEDTPAWQLGLHHLAAVIEQRGDYAQSLSMFRAAFDGAARRAGDDDNPRLPQFREDLARSLLLNGDTRAARALLDAPLDGDPRSRDAIDVQGRRQLNLSLAARLDGRPDEALRHADDAAATFAALFPAADVHQGAPARARGLALRDLGRLDEAEAELRRAAGLYAGSVGRDANLALETELDLAALLLARGRTAEARTLHERMAPLLPARFAAQSPLLARHAALAAAVAAAR